ncbi:competence protein ComK [Halalkalibacter flavus]|uniref:competence protein ComK n=1 Tax=Halalkalibacter flavus TaxID=3090668 RepID=UPI002FC85E3E
MKKRVLASYDINVDTMAIIPINHFEYDAMILEGNETYYVKKKPLQLIEGGCLDGGAEYLGRRESVIHKTGIKKKVPIPINPNQCIYAFPTHAPSLHECIWIFSQHIKHVKTNGNDKTQTIITFNNGKELLVDVSYQVIKKQVYLTAYCILRFSPRRFDPREFG